MVLAIINIAAIIIIPIAAVFTGQLLQNRSQRRDDKLNIFKILMVNRYGWSDESVRAMNIIEIVFADEALKGGDGRIGCIDEAIGNHDRANAGGTEPGKPFTKLIDFGNGIRIQSAAVSLVRTFLGYKCVKAAFAVGGFPA